VRAFPKVPAIFSIVLREAAYGLDVDFSEERLVERYNSDLANDLGNLTSRVLSMVARYFSGEVTAAIATTDEEMFSFGSSAKQFTEPVGEEIEELNFKGALEQIWLALDRANKYIVATSPFTLAKDPAQMPRVAQILAELLERLRIIADTLAPFMPVTSKRMLELLNCDEQTARAPFGQGLKPGHRVNPPVALFPRIDKKSA
jgi:methionyl-tRNA synthetase